MSLDDKQFNTLLSTIKKNVPTDCAAYNDIRAKSMKSTTVLGKTTFNLSDYEAYRNDIDFVNSFNEQVLVDERNYFEKKYTPKVYSYLLAQRQAFKVQQKKLQEELMCSSYKTDLANAASSCNKNASNANNQAAKDFMNYLMKQTHIPNPDTTYKKIEYRNEAHELITTINNWMTILYYILFIVMIVLLAVSNKLMARERFMLYLFLAVLPILFPYLFQWIKYLYGYVFPDSPTHGPKNAFLESKGANVDSFNI